MAKKQVSLETKPCVILDNICPQTPKKIVNGEILDRQTLEWVDASGETVPAGTTIRAGSTVELTDQQIKQLIRLGVLLPDGEKVHFNLEDVFSQECAMFNKIVTVADALRSHGVNTIEQVVNNIDCTRPYMENNGKDGKIKAQEVLMLFANPEQFHAWIAQCRQIVGVV